MVDFCDSVIKVGLPNTLTWRPECPYLLDKRKFEKCIEFPLKGFQLWSPQILKSLWPCDNKIQAVFNNYGISFATQNISGIDMFLLRNMILDPKVYFKFSISAPLETYYTALMIGRDAFSKTAVWGLLFAPFPGRLWLYFALLALLVAGLKVIFGQKIRLDFWILSIFGLLYSSEMKFILSASAAQNSPFNGTVSKMVEAVEDGKAALVFSREISQLKYSAYFRHVMEGKEHLTERFLKAAGKTYYRGKGSGFRAICNEMVNGGKKFTMTAIPAYIDFIYEGCPDLAHKIEFSPFTDVVPQYPVYYCAPTKRGRVLAERISQVAPAVREMILKRSDKVLRMRSRRQAAFRREPQIIRFRHLTVAFLGWLLCCIVSVCFLLKELKS